MTDRAYIISRTLEDKIAIAENNDQNVLFVTIDALKEIVALLKEQETEDTGKCRIFQCKKCGFGIDDIFVNDEEKYQIVPRYCPNCGRSVK